MESYGGVIFRVGKRTLKPEAVAAMSASAPIKPKRKLKAAAEAAPKNSFKVAAFKGPLSPDDKKAYDDAAYELERYINYKREHDYLGPKFSKLSNQEKDTISAEVETLAYTIGRLIDNIKNEKARKHLSKYDV